VRGAVLPAGGLEELASRSCADPSQAALEIVERWRDHLASHGYKPSTLRHYPRIAGEWVDHLARLGLPYDRADPEHVDLLISAWAKLGRKPWTIRCNLAALRTWYKWLRRRHYVQENPFEYLEKMRVEVALPNPIPEAQLMRLIDEEPHPLWRAMWEVFYVTGARIASVRDLRVEDLDLQGRRVRFQIVKGGKVRVSILRGKSLEALAVYLPWRAAQLDKLGVRSAWLWLGIKGTNQPRVDTIRDRLRAAAKRVGIEGRVYPHRLRHSTATHMLEHGADLRAIQEVLGHAQLSTTQIYTQVSQKHLEDTVARTNPRA
jgi:integrase/recombinase XerD